LQNGELNVKRRYPIPRIDQPYALSAYLSIYKKEERQE